MHRKLFESFYFKLIHDSNFCVRTLLLVIKMMVEYCQCVDDTPVLTAELLTKLCEILKVCFIPLSRKLSLLCSVVPLRPFIG